MKGGRRRVGEGRGGKKSKNTPSVNSCLRPCTPHDNFGGDSATWVVSAGTHVTCVSVYVFV